MNVRKFGAPRAPVPRQYVALIAREDRRITKLARELVSVRNRLARARMRKSVLLRLANDEARRSLDGTL